MQTCDGYDTLSFRTFPVSLCHSSASRARPALATNGSRCDIDSNTTFHPCNHWSMSVDDGEVFVLSSPHRLHLRLVCWTTGNTPGRAKDKLDVWPALPLVILGRFSSSRLDSIIAVLEHCDCVYQIDLDDIIKSPLEIMTAAMQDPFPELMDLQLWCSMKQRHPFPFPNRSWVPRSTIPQVGWHSIPEITKAAFDHHSPSHLYASCHSSFWVHFTRGDGHLRLHFDRPRTHLAFNSYPIDPAPAG